MGGESNGSRFSRPESGPAGGRPRLVRSLYDTARPSRGGADTPLPPGGKRTPAAGGAYREAGMGAAEDRRRWWIWVGGGLLVVLALGALLRPPTDERPAPSARPILTPPPTGSAGRQMAQDESFAAATGRDSQAEAGEHGDGEATEADLGETIIDGFKPMRPRPMRTARGVVVTGPDGLGVAPPPEPDGEPATDLAVLRIGQDRSIVLPRAEAERILAAGEPAASSSAGVADEPPTDMPATDATPMSEGAPLP